MKINQDIEEHKEDNKVSSARNEKTNVENNGENNNRGNKEVKRTIQTGQRLERFDDGNFIGQEKRGLEKGHPERIPRWLGFSPNGRWLLVPESTTFVGKYPKYSVPLRVEPYRESKEEGDEEAKEACAYGSDARNNPCWYNYTDWKKHFGNYEEPSKEECTFMNGELFTNKVIKGRFGRPKEVGNEGNSRNDRESGEGFEDYGYRTSGRGRVWSGYGRGQARNYEEEEVEYWPRGRAEDEQGWYEAPRSRGSRARGRGGEEELEDNEEDGKTAGRRSH